MVLPPQRKKPYPYMLSICFKPNCCMCFAYLLCLLFQWGFNKPWSYHISCLFSLVILLCTAVACFSSVNFVWSYSIKSCFPKNKVILSSFLGNKKGSIMTDCLHFDVSLYIRIKKFNQRKKALGLCVLWDFKSRCSSRLHTISQFNNKCTPTISERYHQRSMYQRYEKCLEQQKGRPNVNICAAEKFERGTIIKSVPRFIVQFK